MSVADAFAQAIGWLSDVALHWADHIHPAAGEGPVHQMRVALRRLTTALTVFRAAAPDEPAIAAARAAAKSIAAALGPARDWDVFLATNGTEVATAFPDDERIAGLLGAATRQRAAAYRALGQYLAGTEFRLASLTLAALAALRPFGQAPMTPDAGAPWEEPVSSFAPPALDRRLKRATADPATLDDAALHDLRKAAKRLRYAGEIFAPLYAAKQVRSWQKRVTALQSTLGSLNDGTVTPELLEQLGNGRAFARGVVQGFVAARALKTRRKVRKAWARFSRADPFWR